MHISELWHYPLKSARGYRLDSARIGPRGIEHDREWMVVDPKGRFVSGRSHPELATLEVRVVDGELEVQDGDRWLTTRTTDHRIETTVWKDTHLANRVEGADELISARCGENLRVVRATPHYPRRVDTSYTGSNEHPVAFADGFPILVLSTATLRHLLETLAPPFDVRRLRPNVVVAASEPFDEHEWDVIQCEGVRLSLVKPCTRCVMLTVDPSSGKRDRAWPEFSRLVPQRGSKPVVGENALVVTPGKVQVGDPVMAQRRDAGCEPKV